MVTDDSAGCVELVDSLHDKRADAALRKISTVDLDAAENAIDSMGHIAQDPDIDTILDEADNIMGGGLKQRRRKQSSENSRAQASLRRADWRQMTMLSEDDASLHQPRSPASDQEGVLFRAITCNVLRSFGLGLLLYSI